MNQQEFDALRATFPWSEHVTQDRRGGLIQILDNTGAEVPLFTMTKFLVFITRRMSLAPAQPAPTEKAAT